jgi:hypothetical protein
MNFQDAGHSGPVLLSWYQIYIINIIVKEPSAMHVAKRKLSETIRPGGRPDRLVRQFEGLVFLPGDPVGNYVRGERYQGMPPKKDRWGHDHSLARRRGGGHAPCDGGD